MAIISFNATIEEGNLVLTNTSDLEGAVLLSNFWSIEDVTGEVDLIPITADPLVYELKKDSALLVKLLYGYDAITDNAIYSKVDHVLAAPVLSDIIYDLRKKHVDLLMDSEKREKAKELLELINDVECYYDDAVVLVSSDRLASQMALDMGNDHANILNI